MGWTGHPPPPPPSPSDSWDPCDAGLHETARMDHGSMISAHDDCGCAACLSAFDCWLVTRSRWWSVLLLWLALWRKEKKSTLRWGEIIFTAKTNKHPGLCKKNVLFCCSAQINLLEEQQCSSACLFKNPVLYFEFFEFIFLLRWTRSSFVLFYDRVKMD